MRLATESIRLVSGTAEFCPARSRVQSPPEAPATKSPSALALWAILNSVRIVRFRTRIGQNYTLRGAMVTASKSNTSPIVMASALTTKRGLSILLLILALAIGSVALAHAPAPSSGPTIGTPVVSPTSPTSSSIVTVSVSVTSARSTVKNVTITYTTNNWKSNTTVVATYNATTATATGQIPALAPGGVVYYFIVAFDIAGNSNLNNNNGIYFSYLVPAPTSPTSIGTLTYILVAAGIAAAIAAVAFMILKAPQTKSKPSKFTQTQNQD